MAYILGTDGLRQPKGDINSLPKYDKELNKTEPKIGSETADLLEELWSNSYEYEYTDSGKLINN